MLRNETQRIAEATFMSQVERKSQKQVEVSDFLWIMDPFFIVEKFENFLG